jgi:hypothetical protein
MPKVIDESAGSDEHANLLAVAQVFASLTISDNQLIKRVFKEGAKMLDSPILKEFFADRLKKSLRKLLARKFGAVPPDVEAAIEPIEDGDRVEDLIVSVSQCADLDAFRQRLARPAP